MRLPWLAHDEAPGPYITIPQYCFNKTKQHTHRNDEGLAANVNDSMDAGGMVAADVTQASEQVKSHKSLTKHQFKEP